MTKKIPSLSANLPNEDGSATKEAESLANETLEQEAKKNEHQRKEKFKQHFSWAALGVFWIVAVSLILILLFWVWHLITPMYLHFLTEIQVNKLQDILFSVIATKVIQEYFRKNF